MESRIELMFRRTPSRPPPVEIAAIEEVTTFSPMGVIAVILLSIGGLLILPLLVLSGTILQQSVMFTAWIGWNVLFGAGAVIGRRRIYRVFRVMPEEKAERGQAKPPSG